MDKNHFGLDFRKQNHFKWGVLLCLVVLVFVLAPMHQARAGTVGDALYGLIIDALVGIVSVLGRLLVLVIELVLRIIQSPDLFNKVDIQVNLIWKILRDLSNMFFIVIMLVIAFGTILKIESYRYTNLLKKVIFAAILINFSKTIAFAIIDASQVVMLTFVHGFKDAAAGNLTSGFGLASLLAQNTGVADFGADLLAALGAFALAVFMLAVALVTMIAIGIVLIIRTIALWILVALSPIPYIMGILGATKQYADRWWKEFMKYVTIGPTLAFFLWIAFLFISLTQPQNQGVQTLIDLQEKGATTAFDAGGSAAFASQASRMDVLLNFIITTILLYLALTTAQKAGVAGGNIAGKVAEKVRKVGVAPFKGVGWAAKSAATSLKERLQTRFNLPTLKEWKEGWEVRKARVQDERKRKKEASAEWMKQHGLESWAAWGTGKQAEYLWNWKKYGMWLKSGPTGGGFRRRKREAKERGEDIEMTERLAGAKDATERAKILLGAKKYHKEVLGMSTIEFLLGKNLGEEVELDQLTEGVTKEDIIKRRMDILKKAIKGDINVADLSSLESSEIESFKNNMAKRGLVEGDKGYEQELDKYTSSIAEKVYENEMGERVKNNIEAEGKDYTIQGEKLHANNYKELGRDLVTKRAGMSNVEFQRAMENARVIGDEEQLNILTLADTLYKKVETKANKRKDLKEDKIAAEAAGDTKKVTELQKKIDQNEESIEKDLEPLMRQAYQGHKQRMVNKEIDEAFKDDDERKNAEGKANEELQKKIGELGTKISTLQGNTQDNKISDEQRDVKDIRLEKTAEDIFNILSDLKSRKTGDSKLNALLGAGQLDKASELLKKKEKTKENQELLGSIEAGQRLKEEQAELLKNTGETPQERENLANTYQQIVDTRKKYSLEQDPDEKEQLRQELANLINSKKTALSNTKASTVEQKQNEEAVKKLKDDQKFMEEERDMTVEKKAAIKSKLEQQQKMGMEAEKKFAEVRPAVAYEYRRDLRLAIEEEKRKILTDTWEELRDVFIDAQTEGNYIKAAAAYMKATEYGNENELQNWFGDGSDAAGMRSFIEKEFMDKMKVPKEAALALANDISVIGEKIGHWGIARAVKSRHGELEWNTYKQDTNEEMDMEHKRMIECLAEIRKKDFESFMRNVNRLSWGNEMPLAGADRDARADYFRRTQSRDFYLNDFGASFFLERFEPFFRLLDQGRFNPNLAVQITSGKNIDILMAMQKFAPPHLVDSFLAAVGIAKDKASLGQVGEEKFGLIDAVYREGLTRQP